MEAIEFKAKVKNGIIHIPQKYSHKIGDSVKVIILSDSPEKEGDLVEELLQHPIKLGSFTPLVREEIYERR